MRTICKFSHNSSVVIDDTNGVIRIVSSDYEPIIFRFHHTVCPVELAFIDECKVHMLDAGGDVWQITADGHSKIAETLAVQRTPRA